MRTHRTVIPTLLVLVVAGACRASNTATPTTQPTTAPVAAKAGGTLTFATDAEPANFNYRSTAGNTAGVSNVMRRVWPAVWTITPDFKTELNTDLVTRVDPPVGTPTTIVYTINPAAVWSDGTPITCDDFKYTIDIQREGAFVPSNEDTIDSVNCASGSPKTATVVLKQPLSEWRALFARPIFPAHKGKEVGWKDGFNKFDPNVIISGGPFRIASYNPKRDLTLVRNEKYWGKPSTLDSIVFRFITDSSETVKALENGEVDVIAPRAQADVVDTLKRVTGASYQVASGFDAEFIDFNLRNELLAVPEVRRAIALALDRQDIVNRTMGQVQPSTKVMNNRLYSPSDPDYRDTSGQRYDKPDLAAARNLLEGIGFRRPSDDGIYARDGKELSFKIRTITGDALRQTEEETIQSQLRKVGIAIAIDNTGPNPSKSLTQALKDGEYDLVNLGQGLSSYPTTTKSTFGTGGSANNTGYANAQVDALYDKARAELDDGRRKALFAEIDTTMWNDLPRLPLYLRSSVVAFKSNVLNVGINPSVGVLWNAQSWALKAS